MNEHLKNFVIGSSWLVFIWYYIPVQSFVKSGTLTIDFSTYAIVAPLYLGFLNVIGQMLFKGDMLSFICTGILGAIITLSYVTWNKLYKDYTFWEYVQHSIKVILLYIFVFTVVIRGLDMFIR